MKVIVIPAEWHERGVAREAGNTILRFGISHFRSFSRDARTPGL